MNKNRFVWHDLNTSDVDGAKRFYGEVFNWKFDKGAKDDSGYLHIKAGDQMIGGVPPAGSAKGAPPHWLSYIYCDDVAATVGSVTKHGGKVMMPPMTMDKVGTFAVVADSTGGAFAPWHSARPEENDESNHDAAPFTFCWDELLSTDPETAAKFYTGVFGWQADKMDMGPGGFYWLFNRPGTTGPRGMKGAGGMMKSPPMVPHTFWLPYVLVENVDQITDKAKRNGATITVPATDIPNIGRFSCWMDPQQAAIAVISFPKK